MSKELDILSYFIERIKKHGYKVEKIFFDNYFKVKITHPNAQNEKWYITYYGTEHAHPELYDAGFFGHLSYQKCRFHNSEYGYTHKFNKDTCNRFAKTLIHLEKRFSQRGKSDI